MIRTGPAQMRLRINRLQTHLPHQSLHMFPVDRMTILVQDGLHLSGTVKWRPRILLVDHAHEQQIIFIDHRFIIDAGPGNVQKLRLVADGNISIRLVNERYLIPMG